MTRPRATIQIDMDPFWFIASVFEKNRGQPLIERQTIYQAVIPHFLRVFGDHRVKATFFVVGKDLEDDRNLPLLERLLAEGHEVANHTYSHRGDIKSLSPEVVAYEIDAMADLVERRFGIRPKGFKAPAYGINSTILGHLLDAKYRYDSSVCPNAAAGLVKTCQRRVLRYKAGVAEFGSTRSALAPLAPYYPRFDNPYARGDIPLLEMPVSTIPWLRVPFHFSFVNVAGFWLYRFGRILGKLAGQSYLNYAFHAIDLLDDTQVPHQIRPRPGLARSSRDKVQALETIVADLVNNFNVLPTAELTELLHSRT